MATIAQTKPRQERMTARRQANLDIHKYTANIMQSFGTIFFRILFNTLFKIEIQGKENIEKEKGPVIIVSNHVVFFDSFIFHLFFAPNASLLPLRFMGVTKFNKPALNVLSSVGIVQFIYLLFGVFVITQGEGLEKNLKNAVDILKGGGTVTIFPAGSMRGDNSLGEFKRGAAALALMTNTPIIPVALKRFKERGKRARFSLNVGKKFLLNTNESYNQATLELYRKVEELHSKIS
ncbi:MAG: lysophospholipid acyltransferase family protein [Patescibacteria group bacterium]